MLLTPRPLPPLGTARKLLKVAAGATAPEWAYPTFIGVKAYNNAIQTVPTATFTPAVFNTELLDTEGAFASSAFTNPIAGKWRVSAMLYPNDAHAGQNLLRILVGGAPVHYFFEIAAPRHSLFVSNVLTLALNDVVAIDVYHGKGTDMVYAAGPVEAWLTIEFVGL